MSLTVQVIAAAVCALAIALELAYGARRRALGYAWRDSIASVVLGAGSVVAGLALVLQGAAVHQWLDRHAQVALPRQPFVRWALILVLVDLAFYCSHRAMHRVNLWWAVHAVHHQSDHLNLLVAIRIGWFSVYTSWVFYLPLALVGVSFEASLVARAISSLYQFPQHTRWIGKLGWLERVLVTPSHHRVHHGCDAAYVDRNYGGMLIVWDRLFGTFAAEQAAPTYGTGAAPPSVVRANFVEWIRLARLARRATWRERATLLFRPPSWEPRGG
ncbi:MAG: sterol desaturase family protein [Myxococcales bacterium]|nr:sterol desaturase family protein [Myxococcales bacterium]